MKTIDVLRLRRFPVCVFFLIAALAIATSSRAEDVVWQGVNRDALLGYLTGQSLVAPFDLLPYKSADVVTTNGYNLWTPARVPGAGDTAVFSWNTETNSVLSFVSNRVVVCGSFAPDILRIESTADADRSDGARTGVLLAKDLTVEQVQLDFKSGTSSNNRGQSQLTIPATNTLTVTGDGHPISFSGSRASWWSLNNAGLLRLDGDTIDLDQFPRNAAFGSSGAVDISQPDAVVTLADPGTSTCRNLMLGRNSLRVRSGQTWLCPSRHGSISFAPTTGSVTNLFSVDGGWLGNMTNVSLDVSDNDQNDGAHANWLSGGRYQALRLYKYSSTRNIPGYFTLLGDLNLVGGIVTPGNGSSTSATENNVSFHAVGSDCGSAVVYLGSRNLTTARDVVLQANPSGFQYADAVSKVKLYVENATLDIGGNLTVTNSGAVAWPGYRKPGEVGLTENRETGFSGNSNTVVTLHGSFSSNVRSSTMSNFSSATVNALGGTAEAPNTYEVGNHPADAVASGTFSVGKFKVGSADTPGFVRFVNNHVNDGQIATNIVWTDEVTAVTNVYRVKDSEMQVVGSLSIGPGSTLDLNGMALRIAPRTSSEGLAISPSGGLLDLNTGLVGLQVGDILPTVVGLGDQSQAWNAVKSLVTDSSNRGFTFAPHCSKTPSPALPFDGSTTELEFNQGNDGVDLRGGGDGLGSSLTRFTIEVWIKAMEKDSDYAHVVMRTSQTTNSGNGPAIGTSLYWLGLNAAGQYAAAVSGNYTAGATPVAVEFGAWHHLALTYDGTSQRVYVDGVLRAGPTVQAITASTNIGNLGLAGTRTLPTARQFDGTLAEVRFWNIARSAEDLQSTMGTRLAGNEPGLVAYYPLTEGVGTTVVNVVNGGTSTFINTPQWNVGNTYWAVGPGTPSLILVR